MVGGRVRWGGGGRLVGGRGGWGGGGRLVGGRGGWGGGGRLVGGRVRWGGGGRLVGGRGRWGGGGRLVGGRGGWGGGGPLVGGREGPASESALIGGRRWLGGGGRWVGGRGWLVTGGRLLGGRVGGWGGGGRLLDGRVGRWGSGGRLVDGRVGWWGSAGRFVGGRVWLASQSRLIGGWAGLLTGWSLIGVRPALDGWQTWSGLARDGRVVRRGRGSARELFVAAVRHPLERHGALGQRLGPFGVLWPARRARPRLPLRSCRPLARGDARQAAQSNRTWSIRMIFSRSRRCVRRTLWGGRRRLGTAWLTKDGRGCAVGRGRVRLCGSGRLGCGSIGLEWW